jgi:sphingomyelin phosphodiesterase acid-like 3
MQNAEENMKNSRRLFDISIALPLFFVLLPGLLRAAVKPSSETQCERLRPSDRNTGTFLMLSDIHFDPFDDPTINVPEGEPLKNWQEDFDHSKYTQISTYGKDTRYPLLKSAIDHAAVVAQRCHLTYDYIIVSGDYTYHGSAPSANAAGGTGGGSQQSLEIVDFVTQMIRHRFPTVPVFGALGNNDSDRGDYNTPSSAFFSNVRSALISGGHGTHSPQPFMGYYRVTTPGVSAPGNELLILNTGLWSQRSGSTCSQEDAGGEEIAWLNSTLAAIKSNYRETATLVMHVPPGIDVGSTLWKKTTVPLWSEPCQHEFIDTLARYRGVVVDIYAAHIHRDDFRILSDSQNAPLCPIHMVTAISPIYGNNPAFEVGWYNKANGALVDYATIRRKLTRGTPPVSYAVDEETPWDIELRFAAGYRVHNYDLSDLELVASEIRSPDSAAARIYQERYASGAHADTGMSANWSLYSCGQSELTVPGFENCVRPPQGQK